MSYKHDWRDAIVERRVTDPNRKVSRAVLFLVAYCLATYAQDDGTSVFPGAKRLADDTGESIRRVRFALKALESLGWLTAVERGGRKGEVKRATVYRLTIPTSVTADTHTSVTADTGEDDPTSGTTAPTGGTAAPDQWQQCHPNPSMNPTKNPCPVPHQEQVAGDQRFAQRHEEITEPDTSRPPVVQPDRDKNTDPPEDEPEPDGEEFICSGDPRPGRPWHTYTHEQIGDLIDRDLYPQERWIVDRLNEWGYTTGGVLLSRWPYEIEDRTRDRIEEFLVDVALPIPSTNAWTLDPAVIIRVVA